MIGFETAPSRSIATASAAPSIQFGSCQETTSPGRTPSAASPPAMRSARAARSANETLARVGRVLRDAEIPFAVVGGFAVIDHGYRRFTTDVDVLVHVGDLRRAMEVLRAAGFPGARTPLGAKLHDEENGVEVD